MPNESLGVLRLDVDTYAFGSRFLRRAEITLLNGFVRSLLLTGILLGLFYVMLTQPLVRIIRELSNRRQARLDCPPGHEHDEIGVLVNVANQQFENMETEIQQRRHAEDLDLSFINSYTRRKYGDKVTYIFMILHTF